MFGKKYNCIICGIESGKTICKSCCRKVRDVVVYKDKDDSPLVNYLAQIVDGDRQWVVRKKRNEQI